MAEVVGGAFLSPALAVLFDRMASLPVADFIRGKNTTAGLLQKLKMKLLSVNKLLDDPEEKQLRNSRVRDWLNELKHVLCLVGDLLDEILDEFQTEVLRCKMEQEEDSGSSSTYQVQNSSSISIHQLDKRIQEILDELELIVNEKDVLDLKEGVKDRPQGRLPTTCFVEESSVYGRDEEKEAIIKLLLADGMTGNKIDVLPIVGMGGLGKTTLAQLVYNDDRVKQHFNHLSWFCVSEEFDVTKLTQHIYGSVTSEVCNITDLDMLQVKLKETLSGKKFLFVLDDVWTVTNDEWDLLSRPFEGGGHGSKIIVTTHHEDVAGIIGTLQSQHLMQLSEENCWSVFSKHAFKNAGATADPLLEVIGKQIAQKCKGLPLAAKSVGGLLGSEPNIEKWKEVLNNGIWKLRDEKDVLDLKEGVKDRPQGRLPTTFVEESSVYGRDEEKEAIIKLLLEDGMTGNKIDVLPIVGMGGLGKTTLAQLVYNDDRVKQHFNHRAWFCVSEEFNVTKLILHIYGSVTSDLDLLDVKLRTTLTGKRFLFVLDDVWTMTDKLWGLLSLFFKSGGHGSKIIVTTRHEDVAGIMGTLQSQHLKLLSEESCWSLFSKHDFKNAGVTTDLSLKVIGKQIAQNFHFLRVLNLPGHNIGELPSSFSKLKGLRIVNLSYTSIEKLPDEICTLYNLETLSLFACQSLVELPTDLGRLINLRHLDIRRTQIVKMPPRMGQMKGLQTLSGKFVLDKYTGDNIVEIKELQQLHGTLCISGLRNIVHVTDALETNIRKKHLNELVLEWGGKSGDTDNTQKERDVLENLQPHTNLKKLTIQSYGGTRIPGWLEDHSSLSNLVCLQLLDCGNCWLLPSVEQLPSLQKLEIQGFNGVVTVGSKPSPNLRKLSLRSCPEVTGAFMLACFPKLKSLQLKDVNVESLNSATLLSLVEITIFSCPNFVCFRDGGLDAPNLETIDVRTCSKLRSLPQHMPNLLPSLRQLFLYDCPELESFPQGGLPSKLEELRIWRCKKLIGNRMQWGLSTLTSLKFLSVSLRGFEQVADSFPDEGLLPTTLSRLDIYSISKLDGNGFTQLTSLKQLEIHNCPELRCFPDEGLPTSLSDLYIYHCPLLEQRCQRETGEDWPKIAHIKTIGINYNLI